MEPMADETNKPHDTPDLGSVEGDLFGALFGFHQRIVTLLRQSNLDDGKLKVVSKRIKQLMEGVTAEIRGSKDLNLQDRLDSMYEEVKRLMDDLSSSQGDGEDG
jgi:hypothetical protein